jgi:uncharacterized protein YebE (UPF0316 family)
MEFSIVVIPILIFLARVVDVTMGTLRIIFISRGIRILAALLGFFEVLIWLLAISQIMKNMGNPVNYIAYAAGFGMGNFVGISLERKLSLGNLMVRVITHRDASRLMDFLRSQQYGVTAIDAQGATGPVKIIFMVVPRVRIQGLLETIKGFNPQAFYTVEDVRFVAEQNRSLFGSRRRKTLDRLHGFFLKKK